jgi:molybdenum cofactor biosynthesis protein A
MKALTDNYGRVHDYLRISLTDRCNLNCIYCSPLPKKIYYFEKEEILTFEEIKRLIKIFAEYFDLKKVRFTGGEPFARKDFVPFVIGLREFKIKYSFKTAITTNGVLLTDKITDIFESRIDHFNISLDSLNPDVFTKITGKNELPKVLTAISKVQELSPNLVKINCVMMRGINDNEIIPFTDFAAENNANVRFIEYMPFTNNGWNEGSFISSFQIRKIIDTKYTLEEIRGKDSVSKDFLIKGNDGIISFISSISDQFCNSCSRLRITAKGNLRLCLFSEEKHELDLRIFLRDSSQNDFEIAGKIREFVKTKPEKHPPANELVKLDYNYMLKNGG